MTNPTTNYGWVMPTSASLVTNLPADFNTFGQAVDTSMAELKGGTTGQVLSKTSNTDMDFTWVAQDDSNAIQNAIVDAKGDLIAASANDTPARLAVGSNGETLVADSSTATGLKWAAPATGMSNPMTTTGDIIYSSPGSTPVRRGIGTTGQVLTVSGGVPTWATAAAGGTVVTMRTADVTANFTTFSGSYVDATGYTLTFTPSSATNKITISMDFNWYGDTGTDYYFQITKDGTQFFERQSFVTTGARTIEHLEVTDTNATAASHTYKLRVKTAGGASMYIRSADFVGSQIRSLEIY